MPFPKLWNGLETKYHTVKLDLTKDTELIVQDLPVVHGDLTNQEIQQGISFHQKYAPKQIKKIFKEVI